METSEQATQENDLCSPRVHRSAGRLPAPLGANLATPESPNATCTVTNTKISNMTIQYASPIEATSPARRRRWNYAPLPVVVYTASSELAHPVHLVQELLHDIARGRELGWRLFLRNLQSQYRQTLLGYFWAIMPPLVTTLVWVGLRSFDVVSFSAAPGVPYAAYVLSGTILWQTFLNSLSSPLTSIAGARDMLIKLNFPREVALAGGPWTNALQSAGPARDAGYPACGAARIAAGDIPALFSGPVDAHYPGPRCRAFDHAVRSTLHRYSEGHSGVRALWHAAHAGAVRAPHPGRLALLNHLNPVAPVLVATRDWLLVGHTDFLPGFLVYSILGVVATVFGLILVRIAMPFLIERMGS